ncbi:hypothetical protein AVEN_20087-1 [Araneus ventricosus]|uniref:Uncharacterized protein n=1 Tax=Araneus ventricosus TaxID=182803 RepID=A0A4Y2VWU6_ARAVE|nr:hypothetical protein AVEN_20087-1 [Araneus ventricosus]
MTKASEITPEAAGCGVYFTLTVSSSGKLYEDVSVGYMLSGVTAFKLVEKEGVVHVLKPGRGMDIVSLVKMGNSCDINANDISPTDIYLNR